VRDFSAPVEKKKRKQKRTKNVACNSESPEIDKNDNNTGFIEENFELVNSLNADNTTCTNNDNNHDYVLNPTTTTTTTAEVATQTQDFNKQN